MTLIEVAESAWKAANEAVRNSPNPSDATVRAEQKAWEDLCDLKSGLGMCCSAGCRTPTDDAYCAEHKE